MRQRPQGARTFAGVGLVGAFVAAAVLAAPSPAAFAAPCDTTVASGSLADLQTAIDGVFPVVCLGAPITAPSGDNLQLGAGEVVTLDLNGHALTIAADPADGHAAIGVSAGTRLTIRGAEAGSTLLAIGGQDAAGIGGDEDETAGEIVIESGTVTATGGEDGAGIGGGDVGDGGTVTVAGGTVHATGGEFAAGIGGGDDGDGGDVLVTGGTVTATGGDRGAGIGGGSYATGGTVAISGGTVRATGGENAAGIGGGEEAAGADVTLSGGVIVATGGVDVEGKGGGAGIGGGGNCDGCGAGGLGTLTVNGIGTLRTTGNGYPLGAGGGVGFSTFAPSGTGLCFVQSAYRDGAAETPATTTFTFAECGLPDTGRAAAGVWSAAGIAGLALLIGVAGLWRARRRVALM